MIRIATITCAVAEMFNTPAHALRSPLATRDVSEVRFAVMFLARREGHSFPKIGKYLGRNHRTVMHGCERARQIIAARPDYAVRIYTAGQKAEAEDAAERARFRNEQAELLRAGSEDEWQGMAAE